MVSADLDRRRHGATGRADLFLSHSVQPAPDVLPEDADIDVRLHLHRPQGAPVRSAFRPDNRSCRRRGLAGIGVLCGFLGYGPHAGDPQLCGISDRQHDPDRRGTGQDHGHLRRDHHPFRRALPRQVDAVRGNARSCGGDGSAPVLCTRGCRLDHECRQRASGRRGSLREAAILYADIRSFTSTSATLPPEIVLAVLAEYQNIVVDAISQEGGRVDKFLGDGILATFGAVQPSSTFAADALRAALRLLESVEANQERFVAAGWPGVLRIGTAVAAGPVTVGVIGSRNRLEFTVIGDAVNRAAKLEDANKAQDSRGLTDRTTWDLACRQGFGSALIEERPGAQVTGLKQPLDLVVLAQDTVRSGSI
ncbi:adenylate/guanylate cyclase domain-containing protein [Roseibium salinum]|uniref:Adenylate/guanylate cyclase domain-containing protein n=1 Tax=Roseibium salinum TaxID=1604349 RepID=A0ABT3R2T8_9HYPH|nr:adenylate/guanylate cyclase domain-containing protein [Roseibium sp. DSM 29163]MCX2723398.1 adenylate/guanylate cyclase domain-containing protein [Roseibium sp. DSM 29163]